MLIIEIQLYCRKETINEKMTLFTNLQFGKIKYQPYQVFFFILNATTVKLLEYHSSRHHVKKNEYDCHSCTLIYIINSDQSTKVKCVLLIDCMMSATYHQNVNKKLLFLILYEVLPYFIIKHYDKKIENNSHTTQDRLIDWQNVIAFEESSMWH